EGWTRVARVRDPVPVVVGVAGIATPVVVPIGLRWIAEAGAVVRRVWDAIAVAVRWRWGPLDVADRARRTARGIPRLVGRRRVESRRRVIRDRNRQPRRSEGGRRTGR